MAFLWDSLYSVFERTRNYLVDPPGEKNPENPELAITGEGRGATTHIHILRMPVHKLGNWLIKISGGQ